MDEYDSVKKEIVQLSRLALSEQIEDVRLFVARLVRKYRVQDPMLAEQMEILLKNNSTRTHSPLRKSNPAKTENQPLPVDGDTRLALLKVFEDAPDLSKPLMSDSLEDSFGQIIEERLQAGRLEAVGLLPTRSAVFVGAPGVGKTMSARWLAAQLSLPLYVLDLTSVMSSYLGRSGANLRAALDYAKREPCVLLLDEIDAIAKRRSDDADVGELKRLVTVMLQEVDDWASSGMLLAATNHPELIDPAIWRRFDLIVNFDLPGQCAIVEAIERFLGPDLPSFARWIDVLGYAFKGMSFSDIEKTTHRFRRALALGHSTDAELVEAFVREQISSLDHKDKIEVASIMANKSIMSQHAISKMTGVSRDTIRKYTCSDA